MALLKKDKKPKYTGPRTAWDTAHLRTEWDKKREAAEKNAQGKKSNAIIALEDVEFKAACELLALKKLGIEDRNELTDDGMKVFVAKVREIATPRQVSKWRAGYGQVALIAGKNTRPQPKRA